MQFITIRFSALFPVILAASVDRIGPRRSMGPPPQRRQQQQQADNNKAWSACVWVVAVALLAAVLAGGVCLGLYVTLPPSEVPHWLPAAGLALVALPWAFWISTCAYRCCCSPSSDSAAAAPANVERRLSSSSSRAAVASMPMPSSKSIKSPRSTRHANGGLPAGSGSSGSPTASSSAARRVRFGETTVLGEDRHAAPEKTEKDDGGGGSDDESEAAPLAYNMQSSS